MCLIVFSWESHPDYRLVLATNRDELHARPTQDMHWWPDRPDVLAGRDLQAGGTWFAITRGGRFASVTNYREARPNRTGRKSRGDLVTQFVNGMDSPSDFVARIDGERYAGFNLLAADNTGIWYVSNRGAEPVQLPAGVYGLSNAALDAPRSKLIRARDALGKLVKSDDVDSTRLIRLLADRTLEPVSNIEQGNLPFELARAVTAAFVVSETYGTRCTTTLTWSRDGDVAVTERRFDPQGETSGESVFRFQTTGS
ncbi:MAG: NRDE family protein [Pseudomonadota bacterium]|nr:NRDE family protein [Pseudomonadota bacterium]